MVTRDEQGGSWGDAGGLPVADRPLAPAPATTGDTALGRMYREAFLRAHDWLRFELNEIRAVADDVVAGVLKPEDARVAVSRLAIGRHQWNLVEFCATYCRIVESHHVREDREMFAALLDVEPGLRDVVARLKAEHRVIAAVLVRFDRALVRVLHEDAVAMPEVAAVAGELSDLLLSHLAYEEDQLNRGLGRVDLAP
jgi:Hemerythrin HHE cation binding domain